MVVVILVSQSLSVLNSLPIRKYYDMT